MRAGVVLVGSYAIAWLSFRYFEGPLLKRGRVKAAPVPELVTSQAISEG